jgi:Na+(H+)/acetate symporter ActP
MQFFILGVGVMVFVFFQFNANPIHFNPAAQKAMEAPEYIGQYESLKTSLSKNQSERATWQINYLNALEDHNTEVANKANFMLKDLQKEEKDLRIQTKTLLKKADPSIAENDKDYVFIYYILHYLPKGLIGLLLAVILSAAMSSTASELNALGTITSIDLYRRFAPMSKDKDHYLKMTKWFTFGWGIIAIGIASVANLFENLIQLVNIIGSIFYGNVLGIFLLAFFFKNIKGKAVFYGAIITQILVILSFYMDLMSYLWLNVLGCVLVVLCAHLLSVFFKEKQTAA